MPIYLDNAATSFPKPETVYRAVDDTLRHNAANPGRGGHRMALEAGRLVMESRETVAGFFGIADAANVVFTGSATEAINLGLFGVLQPGDRVVTTSMEHNAVVRPLKVLADAGVEVIKVAGDRQGLVTPHDLREACRPGTRMLVMNHCSNVSGTLQAIEEIGPWCRSEGILFMVDAAQSAGLFPLDVTAMGIDLLAVPGHKSLMGPPGVGFLYVHPALKVKPLIYGGTGTLSQSDRQPEEMPERLESGTLNTPGLAGLKAAIEFIQSIGMARIRAHEQALMQHFVDGLAHIPGVRLFGPHGTDRHGGALSICLDDMDSSTLGFRLDREYDICCRVGLHCAPDAHRTIGSYPEGTVRFSPGYFNTDAEIEQALKALQSLATTA